MISEKSLLRKQMRALRNGFEDRSVLDAMRTSCFLSSGIYRACSTLILYASYGSEADTHEVLLRALKDGKAVYLPRCDQNSNAMQFYRVFSVDDLAPGAFSIPEPKEIPERLLSDTCNAMCVVPGLAFSKLGERLGYGRGYYDTFLSGVDVLTVGFCYDFQIVESVPTEAHDKRMVYLCTEHGLLSCDE